MFVSGEIVGSISVSWLQKGETYGNKLISTQFGFFIGLFGICQLTAFVGANFAAESFPTTKFILGVVIKVQFRARFDVLHRFALQSGVPVVLNGIRWAAVEHFGDGRPLVPHLVMRIGNHGIFIRCPRFLSHFWAEVIEPAFTALLAQTR